MTQTETPAPTSDAAPSGVASDLIGSGQEGTISEQVKAWFQRVKSGDMGALPAIGGFIVISILFAFLSPFFLTEINFANLLTQAATLVTLAMALTFVILLGEIDLSAGVTAGVAAGIFVVLTNPSGPDLNWLLALGAALAFGLATGGLIGFFVAKVGIPSFVVTLGLFLGYQGLALIVIGSGGLFRVQVPEIKAIMNGNMPVWAGWVMLAVILAVSAATSFWDRYRRTRAGVPNRKIAFVWIKLGVIAVLGGAVVALLSDNRSQSIIEIRGVPIVVPIALFILWLGTFVLDRTRYGRYIYAIGGNPEAARRAGVKVVMIRWTAFVVCSSLSVVAGIFLASRVGSVDAAAGRTIVLSGVAAAVVGGVSLFGGRGRLLHAAIGALVIAVIENGLLLLNLPAGYNLVFTGAVLILAATVDALSRVRAGGALIRA
jgi:D-xylose transport system permease protein